ncbi:MAG: DUF2490 domain-containing protein, partial [Proteobacteria bacterium]|nr:DUF2490 domain-containing protein [Pseudomonadota bacterium]
MRALFLLLVPMFAFAGPPDVEIWTSGALEYEATDSLSFELREHLRVNPTPLTAEVLTDVGVEFRAAEFLRLAAAYRIGMVDIGDAAELRHRMAFDVVAPVKLDALRVSLRQRYQARIGTAHNSPKHVLRTRLMA